jgi:hypothetical protein
VDLSAFDLQVNAIDGDKAFELFDEVSGFQYEFLAHVSVSVSFISNQPTGDFKSRYFSQLRHSAEHLSVWCHGYPGVCHACVFCIGDRLEPSGFF